MDCVVCGHPVKLQKNHNRHPSCDLDIAIHTLVAKRAELRHVERERDELKGWKTKAAARLVSMICALESIEEDSGSTNIAPIARGCGILRRAIDAAREGENDAQ